MSRPRPPFNSGSSSTERDREQLEALRAALQGRDHWILATDLDRRTRFPAAVGGLAAVVVMLGGDPRRVVLATPNVVVRDTGVTVPLTVAAIPKDYLPVEVLAAFLGDLTGEPLPLARGSRDVVAFTNNSEALMFVLSEVSRGALTPIDPATN